MPDSTPVYGWPVPVLTDDPNIPADVTGLGLAIEGTIVANKATSTRPVGDSSNSSTLGSNVSFTANQNKNIISVTTTLDHDQWVFISAKVCYNNTTNSVTPAISAYVDVDAVIIDELSSGVASMGANGAANDRLLISIPMHSVFLTAGSHTIRLRGDRDATVATVNAMAVNSLNNTYNPTTLTIII